MNTKFSYTLCLLSLLSVNQTATAKTPHTSVEFKSGIEHDSTLNIVELDQTSEEADTAFVFQAKANVNWQATSAFTLKGHYSYHSKAYNQYPAFNLVLQQAAVDAEYDFEQFSLGASYHYADAALDKNDFLTLQQTSLHGSKLLNQKYYFRVALQHKDKRFDNSTERDATNLGLAADSYVFFNQANTFITFGMHTEAENAQNQLYDFSAITLKTGVSHKFTWLNLDHQVQLGLRWLDRQYDNTIPNLATTRNDIRRNSTAEWTLHFNDHLSLVSKVDLGQHDSNFAAADYNETVSSIYLKAHF